MPTPTLESLSISLPPHHPLQPHLHLIRNIPPKVLNRLFRLPRGSRLDPKLMLIIGGLEFPPLPTSAKHPSGSGFETLNAVFVAEVGGLELGGDGGCGGGEGEGFGGGDFLEGDSVQVGREQRRGGALVQDREIWGEGGR